MKTSITLFVLMHVACIAITQNLLNQPQKIVIDSERNRYLVSMWQSEGDLVQIDSLGNQSYFVENAGMVDGMHIVGDTVYGSGPGMTGNVRGYALETGALVMDMNLAGVQHLSSFVSDSSGILYTSERFGNRIFKINPKTQDYWVFAEGDGLDEPNGLLYEPEKNRLVVLLDQPDPPILAISLNDSTVYTLAETNLEGSDGIARDKHGYYYITGYELPGIYRFNPDFSGDPDLFFEGDYIIYPTYHLHHHSLLITYYYQNDWGEVPLESTGVFFKELPTGAILQSCSPNPFRDCTTVGFVLDAPAHVKLEVYDGLGKTINIILDEGMPQGTYIVSWDGSDKSGDKSVSGLYFISITANDRTETRKVVLLR